MYVSSFNSVKRLLSCLSSDNQYTVALANPGRADVALWSSGRLVLYNETKQQGFI